MASFPTRLPPMPLISRQEGHPPHGTATRRGVQSAIRVSLGRSVSFEPRSSHRSRVSRRTLPHEGAKWLISAPSVGPHFCSKLRNHRGRPENTRRAWDAAEDALEKGMEDKSLEFVENGPRFYTRLNDWPGFLLPKWRGKSVNAARNAALARLVIDKAVLQTPLILSDLIGAIIVKVRLQILLGAEIVFALL